MSTMYTGLSNPVSNDCLLKMKDSEVAQVIQLIKSDFANIVDLHVFIRNNYNNQMFTEYQLSLVNPIGREIIRTLETEFRGFVPWTLNAARKSVKLHIHENCNERLNIQYLASSILERTVSKMKKPTNYKVCYAFPPYNTGNTKLCSPDDFKELDWDGSLSMLTYAMFIIFPIYFLWLLFSLLSYTLFDIKYPKYYKLERSLMSPTSILLKTVWEEKGCMISFFRRAITMSILTYVAWCYHPIVPFQYTRYVVLYATFSIPCSRVFLQPMISSILEKKANKELQDNSPFFFCNKFVDCVNCLTLPFNPKFWKEVLTFSKDESGRRQPVHKSLKKIGIFFLCVFIFFPVLFIVQALNFFFQTFTTLKLLLDLGYAPADTRPSWKKEALISLNNGLTTFTLFVLLFHILFISVFAIQSLLLGIFLNINYFTPYLAFVSVLTFYCRSSWKSLEEKYLVLKRVTYDACQERQKDMRDEILTSSEPGQNEVALPVISKEVYDVIREKFLPYHTNVSLFILKVLWWFVFSFVILTLAKLLHELHITAAVQVVTTASLGIMPHVFNTLALNTSDEMQKAWSEKLKLNVKHLVKKLTSSQDTSSERIKTVLIVQDTDDTVAENIKLLKRCTQPKVRSNNETITDAPVQEMYRYVNGYV